MIIMIDLVDDDDIIIYNNTSQISHCRKVLVVFTVCNGTIPLGL